MVQLRGGGGVAATRDGLDLSARVLLAALLSLLLIDMWVALDG